MDVLYYSKLLCSLKNIFIGRLKHRALIKLEANLSLIYYEKEQE